MQLSDRHRWALEMLARPPCSCGRRKEVAIEHHLYRGDGTDLFYLTHSGDYRYQPFDRRDVTALLAWRAIEPAYPGTSAERDAYKITQAGRLGLRDGPA